MPYGILDTTYIDFPSGVDAAYLQGLRTRAGVDFPRVLSEIDQRLGAFNGAIDPLLAGLITLTTEQFAEDNAPTAFEVNERGEYTLARPQVAEGQGHMLPLRGWDVSLGFTEDGLEAMSLNRILLNIDSMLAGFRLRYRKEILKRLFSIAEVRVGPKTVVTSPGFAGSGTGDNVFTRPYADGSPLPGGYTHYVRDTSGNLAAALKAQRDKLKKMGHPAPYDVLAPTAQVTAIQALTGFVPTGSALVRPAIGTAEALVDPDLYVGVFDGDMRVRFGITDFTDANIAVYKSYGALDPRNPLAWRFDELKGRNAILRYRALYPLDQAVLKQDFGIGTNDRTAATLLFVASSGSYTDPTIG